MHLTWPSFSWCNWRIDWEVGTVALHFIWYRLNHNFVERRMMWCFGNIWMKLYLEKIKTTAIIIWFDIPNIYNFIQHIFSQTIDFYLSNRVLYKQNWQLPQSFLLGLSWWGNQYLHCFVFVIWLFGQKYTRNAKNPFDHIFHFLWNLRIGIKTYIKPNYVSIYLRQNQEFFVFKVCWLYSRSAEGGIASGMKDS